MSGLLLTGIGHLTTHDGDPITDAVVAIDETTITYAGSESDSPAQEGRELVDCEGRAVIPGFVDAHTHLVFAGDRSDEFARRLSGESYADIAASGGGILSTVSATRAASEEQLFDLGAARVWNMIRSGTTTLEIKSGYGLDLTTELRLLRVARRIGEELPVTVRTTFLGAHSVPVEFRSDRDGYIDLVTDEMIPAAAALADYCDVFVEQGAFSVEEARRILEAAKVKGLQGRVHAEQLSHGGGAALAAELGAASADHLDHATEEDASALADAGVTTVLVPGASYSLRSSQAPGPMLWDAGCIVALATDCNPGTSYLESMGLVISLAVVEMGLSANQALWAATRGGALSLGLPDRGLLARGQMADLAIIDAPTPTHIPYRPATNLAWATIQGGEWAHRS
ncbi:MAG: imidazolonepropionase [Acidobacteria bacterium]|nr:imidazolonepropionase [Acidobacteriota bacterium]TDI51195.1 MAG: imidazolonepropionase [Acidobacteriota bacterium]TDI57493.1 MAG: imidazolonepropionase [Acidobacteriota bacterium]